MGRDQRGHAALAASLLGAVDEGLEETIALARWMAANPELSLQEFETSHRYVDYLQRRDFEVVRNPAGLATAFVASHGSPRARRSASASGGWWRLESSTRWTSP